jgi:hypothetical protein
MKKLSEHIPPEILEGLPDELIVLAPDGSQILTFPDGSLVLFLDPQLENEDQEQVNYDVALLFAHVHLKNYGWHTEPEFASQVRISAEEGLAERWGYQKPKTEADAV